MLRCVLRSLCRIRTMSLDSEVAADDVLKQDRHLEHFETGVQARPGQQQQVTHQHNPQLQHHHISMIRTDTWNTLRQVSRPGLVSSSSRSLISTTHSCNISTSLWSGPHQRSRKISDVVAVCSLLILADLRAAYAICSRLLPTKTNYRLFHRKYGIQLCCFLPTSTSEGYVPISFCWYACKVNCADQQTWIE